MFSLFKMRGLICGAMLLAGAASAQTGSCQEFVKRLPNVTSALCERVNLEPSAAKSVKGRTIYVRDVKPLDETPRVRVLVIGGIHGDELSSTSLALHWIMMAERQVVQTQAHWRFIPAINPDGLLSRPPKRMNANGVDLNRNFPTPNWEKEAAFYWEKKTRKDPRRWPGKQPLSEPESQFLEEQIHSFKPHFIVSIHAPYGVLDFDGPDTPPHKLGHLYLDQVGIFPGSLGNYGGVHKGVPVVTIELPNATRTPLSSEMEQMWADLLRWKNERVAQGMGDAPVISTPKHEAEKPLAVEAKSGL